MNRLIEAIKENAGQLKQQTSAYFWFFFQGFYFYNGVGVFAFNQIKSDRIIGEPA
jgi:hypothetical protein